MEEFEIYGPGVLADIMEDYLAEKEREEENVENSR